MDHKRFLQMLDYWHCPFCLASKINIPVCYVTRELILEKLFLQDVGRCMLMLMIIILILSQIIGKLTNCNLVLWFLSNFSINIYLLENKKNKRGFCG